MVVGKKCSDRMVMQPVTPSFLNVIALYTLESKEKVNFLCHFLFPLMTSMRFVTLKAPAICDFLTYQ